MQKHVNLVDLVKSFPANIFLQNLASIQKRTSPLKFAHLAEKSDKGSISNLSTKVRQASDVELAPFRDTLKLEQTRVLALHSEMDSLRTLKSLDASRDVSREQLSMDAKQASQQAKQSERLQFPPLRVPAGTGSLEKSPSKSSGGKEMWAVPVKARSKMKDKGKRLS